MGCYSELPPVFAYKGSALRDTQLGYWVVSYTELVATTVDFVFFEAYDNYRTRRLSRRMIEIMQNLSLRPVLGSDRDAEEFIHILNLIFETDFRQLLEQWGSISKRRDQSDKLGQRACAAWYYYNPHTRKGILQCEYQALRDSPRLVRLVNHPTGFDHKWKF